MLNQEFNLGDIDQVIWVAKSGKKRTFEALSKASRLWWSIVAGRFLCVVLWFGLKFFFVWKQKVLLFLIFLLIIKWLVWNLYFVVILAIETSMILCLVFLKNDFLFIFKLETAVLKKSLHQSYLNVNVNLNVFTSYQIQMPELSCW